ncbi:unnamed protein product [Phytomonas sp. Hart1]|nr:unnamed protein product [Phytomonas sp. Hart1]|eukprot:CCW67136.1 unnamed protein product [Phytomonas sp. isolate Hart1]
MAWLGSTVQSTNVELVSIIEEMRERKSMLDEKILEDRKEKEAMVAEISNLNTQLRSLDERLSIRMKESTKLDQMISETCAGFNSILDASQKLLSSVKEKSSQLNSAPRKNDQIQ